MSKSQVLEVVRSMNPALADKVQFATGQMELGFEQPETRKHHNWRFQGIDVTDGALSRFQCSLCGCWMVRRQQGNRMSIQYYKPDAPNVFPPLIKRPQCQRKDTGHA